MKDTIGVKLPVGDVPAKACMSLKKLTGLSIGEIKQKAADDDFIVICDYVNDDGLKLINKIKREMKKFEIEVRQYEDGMERPSELFDNLEELHRSIDADYDD